MTMSFVDAVDSRYPAEGGGNPGTQEAAPPQAPPPRWSVAGPPVGGLPSHNVMHGSYPALWPAWCAGAIGPNSMAAEEVGGAR